MSVHLVAAAHARGNGSGHRRVALLALVALLAVGVALMVAVALWPAAGNQDLLLAPFRWSHTNVAA